MPILNAKSPTLSESYNDVDRFEKSQILIKNLLNCCEVIPSRSSEKIALAECESWLYMYQATNLFHKLFYILSSMLFHRTFRHAVAYSAHSLISMSFIRFTTFLTSLFPQRQVP